MPQKLQPKPPPQMLQSPKCLLSPWQKLPPLNPKLHHALSWPYAVMTAQVKNVPK